MALHRGIHNPRIIPHQVTSSGAHAGVRRRCLDFFESGFQMQAAEQAERRQHPTTSFLRSCGRFLGKKEAKTPTKAKGGECSGRCPKFVPKVFPKFPARKKRRRETKKGTTHSRGQKLGKAFPQSEPGFLISLPCDAGGFQHDTAAAPRTVVKFMLNCCFCKPRASWPHQPLRNCFRDARRKSRRQTV